MSYPFHVPLFPPSSPALCCLFLSWPCCFDTQYPHNETVLTIWIAIFQKDKARRARERAEEAAQLYKEEHDKWWRGAELHKEFLMDKADQKVTVEIEGEIFPKPQVNKVARRVALEPRTEPD